MNTKNNRKFQETDAHICATFLGLLETHDFDNISISLLCQKAGITRATFYSHFGDMNHFFDTVAQRLFLELRDEDCANFRKMDSQGELHHASILSLFEHILKYRSFYQVYITRVSQLPFLSVVATFEHTDGIHQYAVRRHRKKCINLCSFKPKQIKIFFNKTVLFFRLLANLPSLVIHMVIVAVDEFRDRHDLIALVAQGIDDRF